MAFQRFSSPTLPTPPIAYEESYFMNLIRSIGAYFDIHDSKAGLNLDSVISDFIQLPIGALTLSNGANSNIALPNPFATFQLETVKYTGGPQGIHFAILDSRSCARAFTGYFGIVVTGIGVHPKHFAGE